MDASLVNNFAGKYISMYGTPFDLQELSGLSGLDIDNVTHVRLVDVIGAVSGHSCLDNEGRVINDPYPTNFPSGGFDLDAVGAINQLAAGLAVGRNTIAAGFYPNPANREITVYIKDGIGQATQAVITSVTGQQIYSAGIESTATTISIAQFPAGMYYLTISDAKGNKWAGKIIKY